MNLAPLKIGKSEPEGFYARGMESINRGRQMAIDDKRKEILRGVSINDPESVSAAITSMGQSGDIAGQKMLSDILGQYESTRMKSGQSAKKGIGIGGMQYRAGSPNEVAQMAGQQLNSLNFLLDVGQKIDEKGYQNFLNVAQNSGYGEFLPKTYQEFEAKRPDILQQGQISAGVLQSIIQGSPADEQTNRMLHEQYTKMGLDLGPYNQAENYAKISPSIVTGILRAKSNKEESARSEEKDLRERSGIIAKNFGSESSVFAIGNLMRQIKRTVPNASYDEISEKIISRLRGTLGDYPSPSDIEDEINKMLEILNKKARTSQDKKAPDRNPNRRLDAINSLRKSEEAAK